MKGRIDASSPIPLYYQLKEEVRRDIAAGVLRPGDRLPAEREWEERYGISRITVRQALRDLEMEGLLTRKRGKGTFVAYPKIAKRLKSAASFSLDMEARGLRPDGRVLQLAQVPVPPEMADLLQLAPGTATVYLERLRLANGEPMAMQWSYLPLTRFPGILDVDLNGKSLYEFLHTQYGVSIMVGRNVIEGVVADRRQAQLLHVREGAPLLRLSGTNLDQHGQPVELGVTLYRADKYKFYVEF